MVQNARRIGRVVAGLGPADPVDENLGIVVEPGHDLGRQRGGWNAPVMGPHGAAQEFATHEGAASLVGNLKAPAAHIMALAARPAITAGAGAEDQDRPIAALEGSEPAGLAIRAASEGLD